MKKLFAFLLIIGLMTACTTPETETVVDETVVVDTLMVDPSAVETTLTDTESDSLN